MAGHKDLGSICSGYFCGEMLENKSALEQLPQLLSIAGGEGFSEGLQMGSGGEKKKARNAISSGEQTALRAVVD
jgi:hypothetical protein